MSLNDNEWGEFSRKLVWSILSNSRKDLKVNLEQTIIVCFRLMTKYLTKNIKHNSSIFEILTVSLFISCKMTENVRKIDDIVDHLLSSCRSFLVSYPDKLDQLKSVMQMDSFEIKKGSDYFSNEYSKKVIVLELQILEANNFDMLMSSSVDLFFDNIRRFSNEKEYKELIRYCCILLCYNSCDDLDPNILSVSVLHYYVENNQPSEEVVNFYKECAKDVDMNDLEKVVDIVKTCLNEPQTENLKQR